MGDLCALPSSGGSGVGDLCALPSGGGSGVGDLCTLPSGGGSGVGDLCTLPSGGGSCVGDLSCCSGRDAASSCDSNKSNVQPYCHKVDLLIVPYTLVL